jgi:hypothetical protein
VRLLSGMPAARQRSRSSPGTDALSHRRDRLNDVGVSRLGWQQNHQCRPPRVRPIRRSATASLISRPSRLMTPVHVGSGARHPGLSPARLRRGQAAAHHAFRAWPPSSARNGVRVNVIQPGLVGTVRMDERLAELAAATGRSPEQHRSDLVERYEVPLGCHDTGRGRGGDRVPALVRRPPPDERRAVGEHRLLNEPPRWPSDCLVRFSALPLRGRHPDHRPESLTSGRYEHWTPVWIAACR